MTERKLGGGGEGREITEKTLCPLRWTGTKSPNLARQCFSRQTILDFLNWRMLLIIINTLKYSASLEWLHILWRVGGKAEGKQAFPVILPKFASYSENPFLLLKIWRGEHFSLPNQHKLQVFFPMEEEDLQTNHSIKALEENKIPLIVSAILKSVSWSYSTSL